MATAASRTGPLLEVPQRGSLGSVPSVILPAQRDRPFICAPVQEITGRQQVKLEGSRNVSSDNLLPDTVSPNKGQPVLCLPMIKPSSCAAGVVLGSFGVLLPAFPPTKKRGKGATGESSVNGRRQPGSGGSSPSRGALHQLATTRVYFRNKCDLSKPQNRGTTPDVLNTFYF
ncbi:unnamed protein product [Amoebophrya sp. A120]|nr:unnamed protein product [Amoebophrya sp. A120]|eukprot:GSA120T00023368001.1